MRNRLRRAWPSAGLFALLALSVPGALAGPAGTPGVTKTKILLGGTAPFSGPESAYGPVAKGAQYYFAYVNAHHGVFNRKIDYDVLDDGYDLSRTVQATRQLVQKERVFAIFNTVGTEHTLAIRPFLNQLRIPELFAGSGATVIASQHAKYPWTMGFLPNFAGEGAIYGRYIAKTRPKAKIGVLAENSEYGNELTNGLRRGLHGNGKIVRKQTYEVTDDNVSSQVANLKAAGANTFMIFALPRQTLQAFIQADKLGWRPQIFVSSVSIDPFVMKSARLTTHGRATKGAISAAFLKDPTDPKLAGDRGVRLYKLIMKRYGHGANPDFVAHFYGMAVAFTMVDALKHAGKKPTRKSLLRAATHLDERNNPFLRKGVFVRTSPKDYFPIDRVQMLRYGTSRWAPIGPVVPVR